MTHSMPASVTFVPIVEGLTVMYFPEKMLEAVVGVELVGSEVGEVH